MMTERFRPYKLGPAHRAQSASNASWTECGGWQVAATFGDPEREADHVKCAVGIQDVSALGKLDVKGTVVDLNVSRIEAIAGIVAMLRLKPGHAVVLTTPGQESLVRHSIAGLAKASLGCLHVTDTTAGSAAFALMGPRAADVLSGLTALDLRPDRFCDKACMQGDLARVHATIYRNDWDDLQGYLVVVGRDVGEYIWTTIRAAGERVGITPFGLLAERLLRADPAADAEAETVGAKLPFASPAY